MKPGRLTRRACLVALLGIPGAALPGQRGPTPGAGRGPAAKLEARLLTLLPRDSAVAIGREYLRLHADASLETALAHVLGPRQDRTEATRIPGRSEIRRRLADAVRDDFRNRRIVRVANWNVALTEARLCGLIARST